MWFFKNTPEHQDLEPCIDLSDDGVLEQNKGH